MSNININVNPDIFNEVYLPLFTSEQRTQINFGGSSSGKSYAMSSMVPLWVLQGHSILILRKNQSSIAKSTWLEITKSIRTMELSHLFKINKSDKTIECRVSRGCIMFGGIFPDAEKLKSITPINDTTFSKIILEEATEFSEDDYNDILLRQRGASKFSKSIILLFNPILRTHWIYKRFFKSIEHTHNFNIDATSYKDENLSILKTTYKDNKFLGQEEIDTLLSLKTISPYHYNVYGLGNFGVLGELIFDNHTIEEFDIHSLQHLGVNVGVDFGFTSDPTAIIFTLYDHINKIVYVFDEYKRTKMFEEDIQQVIDDKVDMYGLGYTSNYADSAEPRTIARLNNLGIIINKVKKNKIIDDIWWFKQNKIIVHPRCTRMIDEFNAYVFKKDTNGNVTNTPQGGDDHLCDALRYSQNPNITTGKYISANIRI